MAKIKIIENTYQCADKYPAGTIGIWCKSSQGWLTLFAVDETGKHPDYQKSIFTHGQVYAQNGNLLSGKKEPAMVGEVAKYLKTKKSSIYDKVHNRTIPYLKSGSSSRFRKKHIDIWLFNPYHPDLDIYNLNHNGRG